MTKTWRDRLEEARVTRGIEVETLMRLSGLSSSYWTDIMTGRAATDSKPARPPSSPSIERLHRICSILGKSLDEIYTGDDTEALQLTIIGMSTGEPDVWASVEGKAVRSAPFRMLTDGYVAVAVETDEFRPRYVRGDVVCGPRMSGKNLANLIGQDCIIETTDGKRFIKKLFPGARPRLFDLRSLNSEPDIRDRQIKWAAPIQMIWRG